MSDDDEVKLIDDIAAPNGLTETLIALERWCVEEAEHAAIDHDPEAASQWKFKGGLLNKVIRQLEAKQL